MEWSRTPPLVSIVTPSKDQGRFIEEMITSVLLQDYEPIEHIVVDGGSTDETLDVLRRYPQVQWSSEPDGGQSAALNKGFKRAHGEVFAWVNADDFYLPGAVSAAVAALRETGAGLVYADILRCEEDGSWRRRVPAMDWDLWRHLNDRNRIWQPAAFFTREAFETVGGIDENLHLAMDYDLWTRIAMQFPVHRVDAVWAAERRHAASKTSRFRTSFYREDRRVSRAHGGRLLSPMTIHRYLGTGRTGQTTVRIAAALYMIKELRVGTFARRLHALLGER